MGVMFAHDWLQKQSCDNFRGVLGVVQPPSSRILTSFYILGQNIDSPQYTGDQTVGKRQGGSVGQQNLGDLFVGRRR